MYELTAVTKIFGRGPQAVQALSGVSVQIGAGERVAITGPSGSGKSSLLHLLGGLDRPTSGDVVFRGEEIGQMADRQLTRLRARHFGFVFQDFCLIPTLTALENVEAAMVPLLGSQAGRRSKARELLARVNLDSRRDHLPSELSGGEQQRVAIARAMANDPEAVLADEPTGNLDTKTADAVLDQLLSTGSSDRTLVIVTHDPRIAARMDRELAMSDGRLVGEEGVLV